MNPAGGQVRDVQARAGAQTVPTRRRGRSVDQLGGWLADWGERLFLGWSILNMSGASLTPQQGLSSKIDYSGSSLTDSSFALIYLVLLVLIVLRAQRVTLAATAHKLTLLLIGVAALSYLWSDAPDVTLRRALSITATSAFGWYLVARYDTRHILQVLAAVLGFTAVLSLFYGLTRPDLVMMPAEGSAWHGVYDNKNVFARSMVLSTMVFLLLTIDETRHRKLIWGGAILSALLVLRSQSATGILVLCTLIGLWRFSKNLRLRTTILVPLLILATLAVAGGLIWLRLHMAAVAQGMGKDVTLTGRTDLWAVAVDMIAQRPWLGYGYGGFWIEGGGAVNFWRAVGWKTPHSHNGFLDLGLDLGVLGLIVVVAALATALAAAVHRARARWTAVNSAPLLLLGFVICYNMTESSILKYNTIFWVVYIVATSVACGGGEMRILRHRSVGSTPFREAG
jgi:O-antigen ligase